MGTRSRDQVSLGQVPVSPLQTPWKTQTHVTLVYFKKCLLIVQNSTKQHRTMVILSHRGYSTIDEGGEGRWCTVLRTRNQRVLGRRDWGKTMGPGEWASR
jgi:hypothetical protein